MIFFSVRHLPDPTRRTNRIDNPTARKRATAILRATDRQRFAEYEVVHVSLAKRNEVARVPYWLVLFDRKERTALRSAVVVALRASDGRFVAIREVDPLLAQMKGTLPSNVLPLPERAGDSLRPAASDR